MTISRWETAVGAVTAIMLAAVVGTASGETAKVKAASSDPDAVAKVTGNSAPNELASGLIESPVVQGAQPLENGTAAIPFYGYHGDGPMVARARRRPGGGPQRRGVQDRARQEHVPRAPRPDGPDPNYDYGTHFLFQGHELGAGLHHARQPRRRRRAPGDAAGHPGLERQCRCRTSTVRRGIRGRSACCSRRRAARAAVSGSRRSISRRSSRTSRAFSAAAATRASRTTRTATSGSSRTSAAPRARCNNHARQPNSFVYPLRARTTSPT